MKRFIISLFLLCSVSVIGQITPPSTVNVTNIAGTITQLTEHIGPANVVDIILDSDVGGDVDDIGDFMVAHTFVNRGEANLLATTTPVSALWSPVIQDIFNHWYNRELPVGFASGGIAGANGYGSYTTNAFQSTLGSGAFALNSTTVLRKLLVGRPNNSVVFVCTGPMRTVYNLYNSTADAYSPLTGAQLIALKVKRFVIAAGYWPNSAGQGNNFTFDPTPAAIVNSLTSPNYTVSFVGDELGNFVISGGQIRNLAINNPMRSAWDYAYTGQPTTDRNAWGQLALMYAVRGPKATNNNQLMFVAVAGQATVNAGTGANTFVAGAGNQEYLTFATTPTLAFVTNYLSTNINSLLMETTPQGLANAQDLILNPGTTTYPSLRFSSETNSGLLYPGAGAVDWQITGTKSHRVFNGGIAFPNANGILFPSGALGSAVDVAIARDSTDTAKFYDGTGYKDAKARNMIAIGTFSTAAGTALLPSINFGQASSDLDNGFYWPGANAIGIVGGGSEYARFDTTIGLGFPTGKQVIWATGALGTSVGETITGDGTGLTFAANGGVTSLKVQYATNVVTQIAGSIGATAPTVTGFEIRNDTAAINGTQQFSPGRYLQGQGFGTTAGTSQPVREREFITTVQSTIPTGTLNFDFSINYGAYVNAATLTSGGTFTTVGSITSGANVTMPTTGIINWTSRGRLSSSADGIIELMNNAASGFTRLNFGGTTTSFASLSRNGVGLDIRDGTGANYNFIQAGGGSTTVSARLGDGLFVGNGKVIGFASGSQATSDAADTAITRQAAAIVRVGDGAGGQGTISSAGVEEGIVNKSGNYTATLTDTTIIVDTTGGAVTITLPSAASAFSSPNGARFTIKKKNSSANNVTITVSGGATNIDGATTQTLTTQYMSRTVQSDGTQYWIVSAFL